MDCRKLATDHGEKFKARHARHVEIGEEDFGNLPPDLRQCRASVRGRSNAISECGKEL
jgi:hypothetical protein